MVFLIVPSTLLSFVPAALQVLRVLPTTEHVTIEAGSRRSPATCPSCGLSSQRLHSRYRRTLRDLPWQGRPVTIRVAARRFRCLNLECARTTFAERLGDVAPVSARRTVRLGDLHRHVALALGGEAGAKLADRLAIPTSPDTLLRMATKPDIRDQPAPPPKVLGVDDWAWRRGHRYGTILVDLERNEVVDLLPDRQAEPLADWLRQHPTVEIVARDRAGAYADGIRRGAPNLIQVADRWHLLRNLGDAVRAIVDRHRAVIKRVAKQVAEQAPVAAADTAVATAEAVSPNAARRRSQDAHARRQARYEEAAQLRAAGVSISRIAALLGAERKTIRRWLHTAGPALWKKPPRANMLTSHHDHLDRRWSGGCRNAAQLWRELVQLGFSGRPGTVRRWAGRRRTAQLGSGSKTDGADSATGQSPSGRDVARLLMADFDGLHKVEQAFVAQLLAQAPAMADAVAVAKRLGGLLRRKTAESLTPMLDAADATPLREFAASLRKDLSAIQNALGLPWTTSPVEGQVNRLKMIKRTMYGRAGFDLLRARVLHAA